MEENRKQRQRRKVIFAQKLRKRMTLAEKVLWEQLRDRRCAGLKFRRQAPVSWFIADFLCMEKSLIIEVDGSIHEMQTAYDDERDEALADLDYHVLRLTNNDVLHHLDKNMHRIVELCS